MSVVNGYEKIGVEEIKCGTSVGKNELLKAPITQDKKTQDEKTSKPVYSVQIVWHQPLFYIVLHISAIVGMYLVFTSAMWKTIFFAVAVYIMSLIGMTAGTHRLWAHRAYKARLPLRILLAFWSTAANQNTIVWWARDHRLHHKFSETNADPYNALRGFFFSHMGWLMVRKHPDVMEKGKTVDISDIIDDPVAKFQNKHYLWLLVLCCYVLPVIVPVILWGESFWNSFHIAAGLRVVCAFHITWAINSAAHMWGNRPYDRHIQARENIILKLGGIGEGFHNYHHTFPYDYSASEFGTHFNLSTAFINLMAWCGLAYDLKTTTPAALQKRIQRTGDGSHHDIKLD